MKPWSRPAVATSERSRAVLPQRASPNAILAGFITLQVLTPVVGWLVLAELFLLGSWFPGLFEVAFYAWWWLVYFGGIAAAVVFIVTRKANIALAVTTIVCSLVVCHTIMGFGPAESVAAGIRNIARPIAEPWAYVDPEGKVIDMRGKPFPAVELLELEKKRQFAQARALIDATIAAVPSEEGGDAKMLTALLERQANIHDKFGDTWGAQRIHRRHVAIAAKQDLRDINAYNAFANATESAARYCEAHGQVYQAKGLRARFAAAKLHPELIPPELRPKPTAGRLPSKPGELSPWPDRTGTP
jgi:hypothetical protein